MNKWIIIGGFNYVALKKWAFGLFTCVAKTCSQVKNYVLRKC